MEDSEVIVWDLGGTCSMEEGFEPLREQFGSSHTLEAHPILIVGLKSPVEDSLPRSHPPSDLAQDRDWRGAWN